MALFDEELRQFLGVSLVLEEISRVNVLDELFDDFTDNLDCDDVREGLSLGFVGGVRVIGHIFVNESSEAIQSSDSTLLTSTFVPVIFVFLVEFTVTTI